MVKGLNPGRVGILGPGLDGQGALAGSRRSGNRVKQGSRQVAKAEPVQSRQGQQDGIGLAALQLGNTGINIASRHHDLKIGPDA